MESLTPLCRIANKYGTDKCSDANHGNYTPVYYKLFKNKREKVKKVLEIGIGSKGNLSWTPEHYQNGASLRMWRDFFPNAQIYGADYNKDTLFEDERISTFFLIVSIL